MDFQHLPEAVADPVVAVWALGRRDARLFMLGSLRAISKAAKACTLTLPTALIGAAV